MNGLLYTGTRGVRGVELLKIRPYHFSEYSKHDTTVRFASVVDFVNLPVFDGVFLDRPQRTHHLPDL